MYSYVLITREIVDKIYSQATWPVNLTGNMIPYSFQQDNAPSHATALKGRNIRNSPNMNAIESTWILMRIAITKD
jgi:hypothetical protein